MTVKEKLIKCHHDILNSGDVEVELLKVKRIFESYYLGDEGISNYKVLEDDWKNRKGEYGPDSLAKRQRLAGKLKVFVDEIPDSIGLDLLRPISLTNGGVDFIDIQVLIKLEKDYEESTFKIERLINLCKEINSCHKAGNFLAMTLLLRSLIDIIAPVFGCRTFTEVVNNYSMDRTHKSALARLDNSLRDFANGSIHIALDKAHPYPTASSVNYSSEVAVLLELTKERL